MRLIGARVSLMASVVAATGIELWNAPLMWLAAALAVVAVAAFAAHWVGAAR